MKKGLLGKKLGMTQLFDETGKIVPVTVVEAGPCVVVQKKTVENDGYEAVQVGFADIKEKNVNKPMKGHFEKAGVTAKRFLKEFKLEDAASMNVGDEIKADVFAEGERLTSQVQAKVMALQVLLSVTTSTDLKKLMVLVRFIVMQVQWVHAQTHQEYSKVRSYQVIWVAIQLQSRTLM